MPGDEPGSRSTPWHSEWGRPASGSPLTSTATPPPPSRPPSACSPPPDHLVAEPQIEFVRRDAGRGCTVAVPVQLPRLRADRALATVTLPVRPNWSQPGRTFHLANRSERARVYEAVLTEGGPGDVLRHIDGLLLVDLWDEMVLARGITKAWEPLIRRSTRVPADAQDEACLVMQDIESNEFCLD